MTVHRKIVLALVLLLTIMVAGCSAGGGASKGGTSSGGSGGGQSTTSDGIGDIEALKKHLAGTYADTEWYPHLKSLVVEQQLGAGVIVGTMDVPLADAAGMKLAGDANNAIMSVQPTFATNSSMRGTDAASTGAGWGQKTAAEALSLPAAPTDAASMKTWIDTVFGDSGESWVAAITSISGTGSTLLVKTNLPYNPETTLLGQRISSAIALSGQTFATQVDVLSSDGNNYLIMGQPWPTSLTY